MRLAIGSARALQLAVSSAAIVIAGIPITAWSQAAPADTQEESPSIQDTQDESDGAGEIIVTATRQETLLSRVPISITAMTQETLDKRGITQIDDLARVTPGVNFSRSGFAGIGNRIQVSIRGIESNVGASTTGIYIDDTPIQTRNAGYTSTSVFPAVFDVARVEILRGPQGTLFGSGSEGGTIRFITPDPNLSEYSGYGRAELGFTEGGTPSYEMGIAAGGPIVTDKIGFRTSGYYRRDGGWVERVDRNTGAVLDRNTNSLESIVFRGALKFELSDALTATPSIYYQDLDSGGGSAFWEALSDPEDGIYRSGNALGGLSSDKFVLPALRLDYDFGDLQLVSNTSYLDRDALANPDYSQFLRAVTTGQPYPLIQGEYAIGHFIDSQKGFTQEVRLQSQNNGARFNWVVGLFYNKTKQTDIEIIEAPFFAQMVLDTYGVDYVTLFGVPLGAQDSAYTDKQYTVDKQIAGFAQVDFNITDKLKLTAGGRYAKIDFSFRSENEGPFAGEGTNAGSQSEKPFTPKLGLSYQADPRNLFYASAAKGFRPGGAQRRPPATCAADLADLGISSPPATYDADSVMSYEIGAKNRIFDNKVQISSSAFYIDWKDIQQNISLSRCGQSFIGNLGKAVSKGFDVAIDANLGPLTLGGTLGYTKATFTDTIESGTALVTIKGEPISTISPWAVTLAGQYDFKAGPNDGYLRFDYDFRSKGPRPNPAVFGTDPLLFQRPETHFVTARAGMKIGAVDVSVFARNLFNEQVQTVRFRDSSTSPLIYGSTFRPRTFGIALTANR